MKISAAVFALALCVSVPASGAEPLVIARNAKVVSSDGVAIGRVNRVFTANDAVTGIQLIVGDRLVVIPADTLSVNENGVTTTLSRKEVRALR